MTRLRIEHLDIELTGTDEATATKASNLLGSALGRRLASPAPSSRPLRPNATAEELADHIADRVAAAFRMRAHDLDGED